MAESLSEQVARLERERATLALRFDGLRDSLRQSQQRVHELVEAKADSDMRLAEAERRGARTALTRLLMHAREALPVSFSAHHLVEVFRDREYPATGEEPTRKPLNCGASCDTPSACRVQERCRPTPPVAEEPTCAVCKGTREVFDHVDSIWTWCRKCQSHPPQAVTEPLEIRVTDIGPVFQRLVVRITPEDAQRIVTLASRPTAEDK